MTTAKTIREGRLRAGLTQEQLAQRVGVTLSSVQRWEAGESTPRLRTLRPLADTIGVTIDELRPTEPAAEVPMRRASDISARDLQGAITAFIEDMVRRERGAPTDTPTNRYDSASYHGMRVTA